MPYVKKEDRDDVDPMIQRLQTVLDPKFTQTGKVVYVVTRIVDDYVTGLIRETGQGFESLSEGIKILECAKLEMYRRLLGPYEDTKAKTNGDVYVWPKGK